MKSTLEWLEIKNFPNVDRKPIEFILTYTPHNLKPKEASIQTVRNIMRDYPPPYILLCTGGVDSQAMIYSWLFANDMDASKFEVCTFVYNEHSNDYDYAGLPELCQKYNIKHTFIDFDLMTFLESGECFSLQQRYITQSPQMAAHIKMFEHFDNGTISMSGNYASKYIEGVSATHISELLYAREINDSSDKKKIIPFFFIHDSVIGTSFYNKRYIGNSSNGRTFSYENKCANYYNHGFIVNPQPQKYSGFEGFKEIYEKKYKPSISDKLKYSTKPSKWSFDINHRYKVQEDIVYYDLINFTDVHVGKM